MRHRWSHASRNLLILLQRLIIFIVSTCLTHRGERQRVPGGGVERAGLLLAPVAYSRASERREAARYEPVVRVR
jgi:hypothetical protein